MLGKIFRTIGVFLLGMIFGVLALFGGGYLVATKVKLGKITDKIPNSENYISAELEDMTIVETVQKLASENTTIGDILECFPILDTTINDLLLNGQIGNYVSVDLEALKDQKIAEINPAGAVSVVVSLETLAADFNFDLPAMPIFNTIDTYIRITIDDTYEFTNRAYLKYPERIYYNVGTNNDPIYVEAYEGDTLKEVAKNVHLYFGAPISIMPVTDAITILSHVLDTDDLTLEKLKTNFGIDVLGDGTGLVAKLIEPEWKINEVSTKIGDKIKELKVSDVMENSPELLTKILGTGEDELTLEELSQSNGGKTKFEERLDALTLEDIGLNIPETGIITNVLTKDTKIGELTGATGYTQIDLNARIDALTVADLGMDYSHNVARKFLTNDAGEPLSIAELKNIDFDYEVNNLDVIDIYGESATGIMGEILYRHDENGNLTTTPTKISEIDDEIKHVKIGTVLASENYDDNHILELLVEKGTTVGTINEAIKELTLQEVYEPSVFFEPAEINDDKWRFSYNQEDDVYYQDNNGTYQISSNAGVWLFFLYEHPSEWVDDNGNDAPVAGYEGQVAYKIENVKVLEMNTHMDAVKKHFKEATMRELYEIGFISTKPNALLENLTLTQVLNEASS